MICPGCGAENPDSAAQCRQCNYKFRFGHAYNDPVQMQLPNFRRAGKTKISRIATYVILTLLVLILVFVIILSFK